MKREPNRIPPEHSRPYGCEELHGFLLRHRDDPGGPCVCVAVMLPEAHADLDVALVQTKAFRARLYIVCDTARQAKRAKRQAMKYLKGWVEVPYAEIAAAMRCTTTTAEAQWQTLH